jgi:transposase
MPTTIPVPHHNQQPQPAEIVLGIDTHRDIHVAAAITTTGETLDTRSFPSTAAGYGQLLAWAQTFGTVRRAGVEGTGSYGAALTRHLNAAGITVIEVSRPDRAIRRRRGKTDAIDAQAAALAVLSGRATATAKAGTGPAEMLRMFKNAKDSAVKARTQAINQLKAVITRTEPALREQLTPLSKPRLIKHCAQLTTSTTGDVASAAVYTLQLLAHRIMHLTTEIDGLTRQITTTVASHNPQLLQAFGVGPDSAAAFLMTAGDNHSRLHSEASFTALCGASPIEASSGKTQRHRLNRGGDRQANRALYTVALTRMRWDQRTRDYLTKRTTEGKTRRETIRCLKRYIAREIYQLITMTT